MSEIATKRFNEEIDRIFNLDFTHIHGVVDSAMVIFLELIDRSKSIPEQKPKIEILLDIKDILSSWRIENQKALNYLDRKVIILENDLTGLLSQIERNLLEIKGLIPESHEVRSALEKFYNFLLVLHSLDIETMKSTLIRIDLDAESSNSHQLIREIEEEIKNAILNAEETVEKSTISYDSSIPKIEKAMMDLYQIISPILVNYSGDALLEKIKIISGCITLYVYSTCAKIRNIEKIQMKKTCHLC